MSDSAPTDRLRTTPPSSRTTIVAMVSHSCGSVPRELSDVHPRSLMSRSGKPKKQHDEAWDVRGDQTCLLVRGMYAVRQDRCKASCKQSKYTGQSRLGLLSGLGMWDLGAVVLRR
jgi:hypothetical protein